MIGLRVLKTAISVGLSIFIARVFHLEPAHFAGIVSMLAVQPSVYRSLRHSLSHIASALFSALFAISITHLFGGASFVIAAAALLVMVMHVRLKKTMSLQVAVIVAINTMGTSDKLLDSAAYHQIFLVLIGMSVGTIVNAILKPVHREREEVLLAKSDSMLRVLLHYICLDLQARRITPYKPHLRRQIEEVRAYIEQGKSISQLILEDRWFKWRAESGSGAMFDKYETMVERIRDLGKALQKADLNHGEAKRLIRCIALVIRVQERTLTGKRVPLVPLVRTFQSMSSRYSDDRMTFHELFPYYQVYEALGEYVRELAALRECISEKRAANVRKSRAYLPASPDAQQQPLAR